MPLDAMTTVRYEPIARLVETGEGPVIRWDASHRPSFTPRQALSAFAFFASLGMVGATVGWSVGQFALACAGAAETLISAALFLHYARHACDSEFITLSASELAVERCCGRRSTHDAFDADWVRVECNEGTRGLVRLSQRNGAILVGRSLLPPDRLLMALELRRALGHCSAQRHP